MKSTPKPSTKNLGYPPPLYTGMQIFVYLCALFTYFSRLNIKTLRNALILRSNVRKGKNIRPYVLKRKFEPKNSQNTPSANIVKYTLQNVCAYIYVCVCVLLRYFCPFCCNEYKNMARFARFLARCRP